jgi:hypothetical protein
MPQHNLKLTQLTTNTYADDIKIISIKPILYSHIQKNKINNWINTYVDDDFKYIDVIEHINGMIAYFYQKYGITMPEDFNEDLIIFLYKHSNII